MRLIDADELMVKLDYSCNMSCFYTKKQRDVMCDSCPLGDAKDCIHSMPTVDIELTEEQVKEYCRKRCLVVVDSGLFNEMKARWSRETVRHGHWEMKADPYGFFDEIPVCSACGHTTKLRETYKYCPNCGARMDEGANYIRSSNKEDILDELRKKEAYKQNNSNMVTTPTTLKRIKAKKVRQEVEDGEAN